MDDGWHVKVCDFGLARSQTPSNQESLGRMKGTYAFIAPETYLVRLITALHCYPLRRMYHLLIFWKGQPFTTKSDVYSFSIVLWEMVVRVLTGRYCEPYSDIPGLTFDFQIIIQVADSLTLPVRFLMHADGEERQTTHSTASLSHVVLGAAAARMAFESRAEADDGRRSALAEQLTFCL